VPSAADAAVSAASHNKDAKDVSAIIVRRMDGSSLPFAAIKGKIVVLNFWATWCGPCRQLEPMFNQVARDYESSSDVAFFAVNTDDDETQVAPFVARQKWAVTVVYADGLDDFMKVESLPTVLILGRDGEIVYRVAGLPPEGFSDSLISAINAALSTAH